VRSILRGISLSTISSTFADAVALAHLHTTVLTRLSTYAFCDQVKEIQITFTPAGENYRWQGNAILALQVHAKQLYNWLLL
jgi:hypothetical protein